jgi:hypothetical protein
MGSPPLHETTTHIYGKTSHIWASSLLWQFSHVWEDLPYNGNFDEVFPYKEEHPNIAQIRI